MSNSKKRKILEEDDYLSQANEIIVRDFFPELPKLKKTLAILENTENSPMRYGSLVNQTPNTTLEKIKNYTEILDERDETSSEQPKKKLSLDQFHSTHTSEDNESFELVLKQKQDEQAAKYKWLYDLEKKENQLLLTNGDKEQTLAIEGESQTLLTWDYKARNELMYDPTGKPLTTEELEQFKGPPKEIKYENTRFEEEVPLFKKPENIYPSRGDQIKSKDILYRTRGVDTSKKILLADLHDTLQERNALLSSIDINNSDSSQNLFSMVSTPSISPSDNTMMTWGTISTPVLLDPSFTPERGSYKMPATPVREQIALELFEKNNQKTRMKKVKSKQLAASSYSRLSSPSVSPSFSSSSYSSSPSSSASPSFKASNQFSISSPKISSKGFGSFDAQLSKSYRSPASPKVISATPKSNVTPSRSPSVSKSKLSNVLPSPKQSAPSDRKESLLDNLLKI